MLSRQMPILLVEDDEVDMEAVRRAIKKEQIANPVVSASDGVDALDKLMGRNGQQKVPQPCLILLDINLPRLNGLQFLEQVRNDALMKQNVVFVLTTSARDHDKEAAYRLQAAGYVLKENLAIFANVLAGYCKVNELP